MPDELRLEVTDYTDLTRWRWVLTDADGTFSAGHEVRLDPGAEQFEAFTALRDYVDLHAAPDKRLPEEARIVTTLGNWIGTEVFGPDIGRALLEHHPATVQILLPAGAEPLAYLPLEAARLQGRSLAGHDLTLVIRPPAVDRPPFKTPRANNSLRVLGLFSLPEGGTALNLRRERQSLVQLIEKVAATGRAADVKALQYGVTRDKLRAILQDGEGWDIIHISGHGVPGQLILETADGRPDRIPAEDLADILDLARDRVKLVTVSACWSAALATAEPRRLLGLPTQEDQRHFSPERIAASPPAPTVSGDIATTLASRLRCAVLAMRFPVGDEFAIELSAKLYELLVDEGQNLPDAVGMTLKHLAARPVEEWFPALSMAAPAIFGESAAGLTLKASPRTSPVSYAAGNLKMAGFPPQPERFVGRTAVMACASAALASESGVPGVLLHGMPGGGKTACALELAHTHEDAFDKLIWFKAPDEGATIDGSLTDLALTLERELPGLEMIDKVVTEKALTAFLPTLTELMERNRLLLVIDNAESLLTDSGQWRDAQWGRVAAALTGHVGLGRLIMTSRRITAGTPDVRVESVEALSADEALLLIRELPHLHALISGQLDSLDQDTARNLALGVLNIAQGHPKLLELANGQAAQPEQLIALVQSGGQAWQEQGTLPDGFFTSREATAVPEDYVHVVATWTNTVTDTLSPGERDLFWFLCCLEEPDRELPVLTSIWDDLRRHLGRSGKPPTLDQALQAIASLGLTSSRNTANSEEESCRIHPSVAAAGRAHAGHGFQSVADTVTAAYWTTVYEHAREGTSDVMGHTQLMVRAGFAAVPYLLRQQQWDDAATLLSNAFDRDPSRANASAMLPAIQQITSHEPRRADVLATILQVLDPATAETQLRTCLNEAVTQSNHQSAAAIASRLANLYLVSGRLDDALSSTELAADYTRRAGLGSWPQLAVQSQRLQVLTSMGQARQVFAEVQQLISSMSTLPSTDEHVIPSNIREMLLGTGRRAALQLDRREDALNMNAALITSMRDRHAPAADIVRAQISDYGPLLNLDRTDEALALLKDCRQAYADANNIMMLGKTLTALARTESERGHGTAAIRFERDALRYKYQAQDMTGIAVSYHNLGTYLSFHVHPSAASLASHLTAPLISTLIGMDVGNTNAVGSAAIDLNTIGADADPPTDVADLCRKLGDIPGTDPIGLIANLSPDPEAAERTLQDLIAQARVLAQDPDFASWKAQPGEEDK